MDQLTQILTDNWGTIAAITAAVISEVMALNPNWQYNGILQAVVALLRGKK